MDSLRKGWKSAPEHLRCYEVMEDKMISKQTLKMSNVLKVTSFNKSYQPRL